LSLTSIIQLGGMEAIACISLVISFVYGGHLVSQGYLPQAG
jgi:hypothetical protein